MDKLTTMLVPGLEENQKTIKHMPDDNNTNGLPKANIGFEQLLLSSNPMLKSKQLNAIALMHATTSIGSDHYGMKTAINNTVVHWNKMPLETRKNPTLISIAIRGSQYWSETQRVNLTTTTIISRVIMLQNLMKVKLGDKKETSLLTWLGRNYRLVIDQCSYDSTRLINYINLPSLTNTDGSVTSQEYSITDEAVKNEIHGLHSSTGTAVRWFDRIHCQRIHSKNRNAGGILNPERSLRERLDNIINGITSVRPHRWDSSLTATSLTIANRLRPSGECLGIELEFVAERDTPIVNWESREFPVHPWLYFKGDGSIRPNLSSETLAPYQELTWFINGSSSKDWDNMEKVLKALTTNGAKVNNTCGNHVHLDMRHRTNQSAYRTASKVRDAIGNWAHRAVSFSRSHNHYCGIDRDHQGNRYTAVNTQCLSEHNTIEIRLGMPTLNYYKLKYWSAFMQYLAKPYTSVATLEEFMESDASIGLKHYVFKRILKFENTYLNNSIPALPGFDNYQKAFNAIDNGVE